MCKFLVPCDLPKLSHEDTLKHPNRPITSNKIKSIIKISQKRKAKQWIGLTVKFYQTFKERMLIHLKLF
jgi:hypothetical protein